jgi:hypothetical protein
MMSHTDVSFSWFLAIQLRQILRVGADTALVPLCISWIMMREMEA